ncbi:MAG: serine hydrolase [Bacteroidales bacterium]|nr:serine hydrolase [Bacteroidales bacterium]
MRNFRITKTLLIVTIVIGAIYLACPPYLRKALVYQTVDIDDYKIFTNRTVIAGNYQPWEEMPGYNQKEIQADYIDVFTDLQTVAYLVIQNDKIIFENYWGGYSQNSLSNSFSMAKSIISILIGVAIDEGRIDSVDDSIGKYLPEFSSGDESKVTIRHLLEMSSGLSWDEAYASPFSMTTKGYYGQNLAELVLSQESEYAPGKTWDYKSGNTQVLALILEKVSRGSVSAYASASLWKPMGAKNDALWSLDKEKGVEKAYCCFNSNARDFARFGRLILHNGDWNGQTLVSEEYLRKALTPATHLTDTDGKTVSYYGWQWWMLEHKGKQVYYMRGVNGQYVFVVPESDLIIVRLGHKRSKDRTNNIPNDIFTWLDAGFALAE